MLWARLRRLLYDEGTSRSWSLISAGGAGAAASALAPGATSQLGTEYRRPASWAPGSRTIRVLGSAARVPSGLMTRTAGYGAGSARSSSWATPLATVTFVVTLCFGALADRPGA